MVHNAEGVRCSRPRVDPPLVCVLKSVWNEKSSCSFASNVPHNYSFTTYWYKSKLNELIFRSISLPLKKMLPLIFMT